VLTGISRRAEGMRPAEMDAVHRRELLAQERPRPPALPLVLECEIAGHVAGHVLDDSANGSPGAVEPVKRADLCGILVGNVLHAELALQRCGSSVLAIV